MLSHASVICELMICRRCDMLQGTTLECALDTCKWAAGSSSQRLPSSLSTLHLCRSMGTQAHHLQACLHTADTAPFVPIGDMGREVHQHLALQCTLHTVSAKYRQAGWQQYKNTVLRVNRSHSCGVTLIPFDANPLEVLKHCCLTFWGRPCLVCVFHAAILKS